MQAVTTAVTGQCGSSPAPVTDDAAPLIDGASEILRQGTSPFRWRSVAEFLEALEGDGLLLNPAFLVGHGTLRYAVMRDRAGPLTDDEMRTLCHRTRQALRDGAFGLSAGLAYAPGVLATDEEFLRP